eukprot:5206875-Pyramimonas_sp.AAC.1
MGKGEPSRGRQGQGLGKMASEEGQGPRARTPQRRRKSKSHRPGRLLPRTRSKRQDALRRGRHTLRSTLPPTQD